HSPQICKRPSPCVRVAYRFKVCGRFGTPGPTISSEMHSHRAHKWLELKLFAKIATEIGASNPKPFAPEEVRDALHIRIVQEVFLRFLFLSLDQQFHK